MLSSERRKMALPIKIPLVFKCGIWNTKLNKWFSNDEKLESNFRVRHTWPRGKISAINFLYLFTGCLDLARIAGQKKQRLPHTGKTCLDITPDTTLILDLNSCPHRSSKIQSSQFPPSPPQFYAFFPFFISNKHSGFSRTIQNRRESKLFLEINRYLLKSWLPAYIINNQEETILH